MNNLFKNLGNLYVSIIVENFLSAIPYIESIYSIVVSFQLLVTPLALEIKQTFKVLDSSKNQSTIIIGILTGTMIMFMMMTIGISLYFKSKKRSSKKPKSSYDNSEGKDTKDKVNPFLRLQNWNKFVPFFLGSLSESEILSEETFVDSQLGLRVLQRIEHFKKGVPSYNMGHPRRGTAIIFNHEIFNDPDDKRNGKYFE